jgi:16S rRNA (cytosine1402-N4)-methyltransferase
MKGKKNKKLISDHSFDDSVSSSDYHIPVLANEVIELMQIKPEGVYVDCTFGGGGHSKLILQKLGDNGKLIAFDQDVDVKQNIPDDKRVVFVPHNFRHLKRFLKLNGIDEVDGVLADLGVSSHQFDEPERGFSTRFNAVLDMRMDQRQELSAIDILNTYSEIQLHKLFEQFGEVTNAKTLARTIVEARKSIRFKTIENLKNTLGPIVKGNPNKYFAQVFQALRMEVNDELNALKEMLEQVPDVLKKEGRVVMITFHSIEDRIVKIFFKNGIFELKVDNPFEMTEHTRLLRIVNKKPIIASEQEIKKNPRSRSAKLRVAEKI